MDLNKLKNKSNILISHMINNNYSQRYISKIKKEIETILDKGTSYDSYFELVKISVWIFLKYFILRSLSRLVWCDYEGRTTLDYTLSICHLGRYLRYFYISTFK